ncbi:MAG: M20/M25/M40 family metallo-hydrolase [Clostridia bacterium]|nr:M20/M25/M40 family metallo-hydrolase [Clostridia bacterium]
MTEMQPVFDRIDALFNQYLTFWMDICNLESPTSSKAGVDAVGAFCRARAEQLGWECEVCPQAVSGDALCLTMNPSAQQPPVVLSSHMDTVHPIGLFGTPATHCDGENIYGPGVADCKGGIVAAFLAMDALQQCGYTARPVRLILQSDEEVSSATSNKETVKFMAEKARGCVAFLNGEPSTEGKLTVERKGIIRYIFEIHGKAAHSSICYDGVSAIAETAHKILELEKWKDKDGITGTCSIINGGSAANTVPEICTLTVDVRYKTAAELEEVKQRVREIADTSYVSGTTCKLTVKSERVSMEKTLKNIELFHKINRIYTQNGLSEVEPKAANGGSDAADMTSYGIPCLDGFGVRGGRIHSRDEYAVISSLGDSAKRMAAIICDI